MLITGRDPRGKLFTSVSALGYLLGRLPSAVIYLFSFVSGLFARKSATSTLRNRQAILVIAGLLVSLSVLIPAFVTTPKVNAATSSTLNFQGRLLDASGNVVADGTYNIQFNLYTVSSGGTTQWTESYLVNATQGVTIKSGYFSVNLGSLTSFPSTINWDQEQWLGMTVRGTNSCTPFSSCASPADAEMTPRFKLTAVPYAFQAGNAQAVSTNNTNAASTNSNNVTITSGNAAGATSNSGNVTIDTGTATGTTGSITLGATNASALTLGRSGLTTTNAGNLTVQGGTATLGTTTQAGSLVVSDGSGNTGTIVVQSTVGDYTFTIPTVTANDTFCLLTLANCGGGTLTSILTDNIADAWDIQEGTNNYININTTNSSENISFGNATTNPSYNFLGGGTLTVAGDVSIQGNATLGNATSDTVTFTGRVNSDLLPSANDTYNLGSDTNRWANIYLGGETIHLGASTSDESTFGYNASTDSLIFKNATDSTTAFMIQNAAGTNTLLSADTVGNTLKVTDLLANVNAQYSFVIAKSDIAVDSTGSVGQHTSIAMGTDGYARIAYFDTTNTDLKYVQCTNNACSTSTITTVDSTGTVGQYTSIAMGTDGYARISYYDNTNTNLKYVQCTNNDCSTSTITTIDSTGTVGWYTSIAMGTDGFARISYYDSTNGDLKYVQCTNNACSTSTITTVDSTGTVGQYTSIAIGTDGFARISYYDATNTDLKYVQCTNNACSTSTITTVDSTGIVGQYTSIAMGTDGFARISYYDASFAYLKYVQCTNDDCSTSTITTIDSVGSVGQYTSIAIGTDGYARISYFDTTNTDLKYAQCTNNACSTSNITTVDSTGAVGQYTSIAIGTDGYARIAYYDATNTDLKLSVFYSNNQAVPNTGTAIGVSGVNKFTSINTGLVYSDALVIRPVIDSQILQASSAAGKLLLGLNSIDETLTVTTLKPNSIPTFTKTNVNITTVDSTGFVGAYPSIAMGTDGLARIAYYDTTNADLKYVQCTNDDCSTSTITTVDSTGTVGTLTSIAIGTDGFARIAYYDTTNADLKYVQCTNNACSTSTITTVDSTGNVGQYTSIAIGTDGFARIAYYDTTNTDLKYAQCTNNACSTSTITTVDSTGTVGQGPSIAMGTDGFARISYFDTTNTDLKYAQCTNNACSTSNITTVDSTGAVGQYTSIAMGTDGYARISYYDSTNVDLKYAQCTNNACSTSTITTVDSAGFVGTSSSIAIGTDGFARISYFDSTNTNLKYAQCTNNACSTSNIATVDSNGYVGGYTSIAMGTDGYARIAYYGSTNFDLKYARLSSSLPGFTSNSDGASLGQSNNRFESVFSYSVDSHNLIVKPEGGYDGVVLSVQTSSGSEFASFDSSNKTVSVNGAFNISNPANSDKPVLSTDYSDTASPLLKVTNIAPISSILIDGSAVKSNQTVDSTGTVGQYTSIAIGTDGFARIAYYDATNFDLKYVQCTNNDCSTSTITTVDSTGTVGQYTSIAIGTDGYARIAYYDGTNADLKYVQCTNNACSTSNKTTVDSTGNVGQYTSIAIGTDGYARISYYSSTNNDLKYVQCTNNACSTSTITTVDSTGLVGLDTSIAIGTDGYARISYYDNTNADLKYVQCTNNACSTSTITTVDSTGTVGQYTSIAIGTDGLARIAYYDTTNTDLKYAQCTNNACSTSNKTTVDSTGTVGQYTSIAMGTDGFARMSYNDVTNGDLKYIRTGFNSASGLSIGTSTNNFFNVYSKNFSGDRLTLQSSFVDQIDALQVKNNAGSNILTVNTINNSVELGDASTAGKLVISDGSSNTGTILLNATAGDYTFTIPTVTANDTFCLVTLANCGGATLQTTYNADADGSDSRIDLTAADDSIIFSNPSSGGTDSAFVLKVEQLNTGAKDALVVTNSGTGNIATFQTAGTTRAAFDANANLLAVNSATGTTGTTEATARTNVTTVTLTAAGSFANNDIIFIDNAGQDYYTRIVSGGGTTTLTVSPAVSYDVSASVTKYIAQNIGATSTDYTTQTNRYFQGYFLGGVVTGAGSTTLSDGRLTSTGILNLNATGITVRNTSDSATSFQIQDSTGANLVNVDTTARSGSGGNLVKFGNSTGTDTATTIVQLDSTTANPTTNLSALNGGLFYNSTTNKISVIENGTVKALCNETDLGCGTGGGGGTLQSSYTADVDGGDAIIALTSTDGGILIRDASTPLTTAFAVQNNGGTANLLGVSSTAVVMQDSSGNNALYFDSVNSELRVYENVATPSRYLKMYYDTANNVAVYGASSGATQIGTGSGGGGNINLNLVGAATDTLNVCKSDATSCATGMAISAAYSNSDFNFTRNVTIGSYAVTGNVAKIEDLSGGITSGSSAPNVLVINQNNTSATGNLILAQTGGATDVFKVSTAGVATLKAGGSLLGAGALTVDAGASTALNLGTTNASSIVIGGNTSATLTQKVANSSTTAFVLQTAGATNLLVADTTNSRLTVGTSDTTGTLLVLDTKTGSGDPTGVAGGMYYNSNAGVFRCYEGTVWKNCIDTPSNASTADQVLAASATTYLTNSNILIPTSGLRAGSTFTWRVTMSKTAAGTVANTFDVRFGTNGTTADTSRCSFAMGTQTAVADVAVVDITVTVRSVSATGVIACNYRMTHNLAATGFDNAAASKATNVTSAAFDNTVASSIIGLSYTTGAAYAITVQQVQVTTTNL